MKDLFEKVLSVDMSFKCFDNLQVTNLSARHKIGRREESFEQRCYTQHDIIIIFT